MDATGLPTDTVYRPIDCCVAPWPSYRQQLELRALEEFGRHFDIKAPPGVQLPHLDFCSLAAAQGIKSMRVERCAGLDAALREVFAADVPMLLEVRVI